MSETLEILDFVVNEFIRQNHMLDKMVEMGVDEDTVERQKDILHDLQLAIDYRIEELEQEKLNQRNKELDQEEEQGMAAMDDSLFHICP